MILLKYLFINTNNFLINYIQDSLTSIKRNKCRRCDVEEIDIYLNITEILSNAFSEDIYL